MSSQQHPILVTGATGQQGGATARRLLADGVSVRALVRDPHAREALELAASGAELVTGDFDVPDSLIPAVTGARGVFVVPPAAFGPDGWDIDIEARRGVHVIEAAARAGVDHIVFTGVASMPGKDQWGSEGKRRIEAAAVASGLRYTLLRPVRFMENYLAQGLPVDGIDNGVHRHIFRADHPVQMIALADIAEFAAIAFADPDRFHSETLELAGDAFTPVAAAEAISKATGYPVGYHELTEAQADRIADAVAEAWRRSRASGGWHADIPALRELHPGLQTLETWLAAGGSAKLTALFDQQQADARP
ncbi:NmrA family NAD(P)-binding protein [Nocardia sp. NPDC005366]|uniref:NmrA family NAD(P)-binding protein n=1 Tax=Nocardia sp. NPDC005366 TaxID=3156878 RepID=UPI0033A233A7